MPSPSPICTVSDNGGGAQATTNGVNITPATTTTIALGSTAGVNVWSLTIVGTDELVVAPTVTVNNTNKTATFTAPVAGSALRFQSVVNSGQDVNGAPVAAYTTTFEVFTLQSGNRVFATNETTEGNAAFGWITKINPLLRSGGGGGSTPTGTGIPHIVSGVQSGAASLIVNADVDPAAAIDGSKLVSTLNVTTAVTIGSTVAAAGLIRIANSASAQTILAHRNAANSGDVSVITNGGGNNALTIGDATNGAALTVTSGTGDCFIQTGNGTYMQFGYASGNATFSTTGMLLSNAPGSGTGIQLNPQWNGAVSIVFGIAVTSATINVVDTAVNSATGIVVKLQAQNATGTTTTGGELQIGPGTGTTANGKLNLINIITGTSVGAAGGATALPATPTGYLNVKINSVAQRIPYYA